MDYENKYNEALERARKEYKTHESFKGFREMLLHIFPEFEESEDEKIRKFLIDYFSCLKSTLDDGIWKGFKIDDIITYIGSQKKQKPVEWGEEDEYEVKDIIYFLNSAKKHYASTVELEGCIHWLWSLLQRMGLASTE